jgi:hypothetical protein
MILDWQRESVWRSTMTHLRSATQNGHGHTNRRDRENTGFDTVPVCPPNPDRTQKPGLCTDCPRLARNAHKAPRLCLTLECIPGLILRVCPLWRTREGPFAQALLATPQE